MIQVNLKGDNININPVSEEDLLRIWEWYGDERYKYATGWDRPLTFKDVRKKYFEARCDSREFFFGIYIAKTENMIGAVKGRVRYLLKDEAWISSLLVDEAYQHLRVGHWTISLLEEYFKDNWSINWLYTGVVNGNDEGMLFWKSNGYNKVRKARYKIIMDDKPKDVIMFAKYIGVSDRNLHKRIVM